MAEDRLLRDSRKHLDKEDAKRGIQAIYRIPAEGVPNISTGAVTSTPTDTDVVVRPAPYTMEELIRISQAGLTTTLVRWKMQAKYRDVIEDGHILLVSSLKYEIRSAQKDPLGIEWILMTRRFN